jgi:hypothetical protein
LEAINTFLYAKGFLYILLRSLSIGNNNGGRRGSMGFSLSFLPVERVLLPKGKGNYRYLKKLKILKILKTLKILIVFTLT